MNYQIYLAPKFIQAIRNAEMVFVEGTMQNCFIFPTFQTYDSRGYSAVSPVPGFERPSLPGLESAHVIKKQTRDASSTE